MVSDKTLEAVIFDMDGVILDTERALLDIWLELAEEYPLPDIRNVYISVCGTTHEKTAQIMHEAYGEEFPFEELDHRAYTMRDIRYRDELPVKTGIRELLELLKENGIRTALATSTARERVTQQLGQVDLLSYFDLMITGDMVTHSKPDPEIFLKAIDLLQVSPDHAIIIEDSFNGVRAAAQTQAEVIMVPDLRQPDEEISQLYDWNYPSLLEVCGHIKRRNRM